MKLPPPWRPRPEQEDSPWPPSNYSPAESAVDLQIYMNLKRAITLRSLALVLLAAAPIAFSSPLGAFSLITGGVCGVLNMWLAMHGNERLVEHRSVGAFVFSSFLRVGVFAIVPVGLALHGPWWTFMIYFAGFFTPLALYMISVQRAFNKRKN